MVDIPDPLAPQCMHAKMRALSFRATSMAPLQGKCRLATGRLRTIFSGLTFAEPGLDCGRLSVDVVSSHCQVWGVHGRVDMLV